MELKALVGQSKPEEESREVTLSVLMCLLKNGFLWRRDRTARRQAFFNVFGAHRMHDLMNVHKHPRPIIPLVHPTIGLGNPFCGLPLGSHGSTSAHRLPVLVAPPTVILPIC